jgi:hypothetical protein
METSLDQLNARLFNEQLHTKFQAVLDDGKKISLELEEVEERNTSRTELFFLRFRGPSAPFLMQKGYRMEHDKLGEFTLFISAIGADQAGVQYEAVFHRIKPRSTPSNPE